MAAPLFAARRAAKLARRAYPVARALKRRWDNMSPEEKERHRQRAVQAAQRVRDAGRAGAERVRARRPRASAAPRPPGSPPTPR